MHTPTIHHTDPTPEVCGCTPLRICLSCMGKVQRLRYELELRDWLRTFGTGVEGKR